MSDIVSVGIHLANTVSAKANVRSEPPPPLTIQDAVAQTLNTPQTAVLQSPTAGNAEWKQEATPDGRGHGADAEPSEPPARQQLEILIDHLNRRLEYYHQPLRFELDDQEPALRVRVVDCETRNVVRWMNIVDTLAFARAFAEQDLRQTRGTGDGYANNDGRLVVEGGLLRATA
ncbi:flagellar protein FlaG [Candidatus Contendibacter odensensis]|uniref:Uncharacterized protein n=1 Tax=Candidatus Contendobacter odensis Run_B_J11 TaxID=1400861 RepID=A0A7U7J3G9_9GAMM|nr:flagellar protein FlaG [Candidatus Contendobacter odensis]CDH44160.1 hypothetical protein BN874_1530008 [Candidatus Contendobacter odensis Run_B_J11]